MRNSRTGGSPTASAEIEAMIARHDDWRGETLGRLRALIREADPEVVEEVKWRKPSNGMLGVPVWSHDGIICTGETYKDKVKLTFASGASLPDPGNLFNASLDGNARRAIDIHLGGKVNARAFKTLVRAAVAFNSGQKADRAAATAPRPVDIPPELQAVFDAHPDVARLYDALPPAHRRAWAAHVAEAKRPETRERRAQSAPAGIRAREFPR